MNCSAQQSWKKQTKSRQAAKQNDAHKTQLDAYKEGTFYESGVAMSLAKKTLKAVPRNPDGTPADEWKCPYYHPLYCTELGHSSCGNKRCGMKLKSKVERAAALKIINAEQIEEEVKRNATFAGTYLFGTVLICTYIFLHETSNLTDKML